MKRKKQIRNIFVFIVIVTSLVSGCATGEKEDTVTGDAGYVADTMETAEDGSAKESEESGKNSSEETENTQFIYEMNENFIGNFNEVFSENEVFLKPYDPIYETHLEMPECIIREEDIVGEFCEGFPVELQQFLIYENDSRYCSPEESDMLETYGVDYEYILDYDPADLPLAVDPPDNVTNYGLIVVDIDSDGEDEFIHKRIFDGYAQMTVLEYGDESGWNIIGQGTVEGFNSYVLDYEGTKYYIMLNNLLVCRNDAYDGETSSDSEKPWNVMVVNKELAGYTLNEIYSGEEENTDYLSEVDMRNLEDKAERYYFEGWWNNRIGGWNCGDWWLDSIYDWEQEYDGKTYLYVVSGFARMGGWPHDLVLTIFEEGEGCMETVKIYYFAAHYQLSLENVEYDTDWGDMCNQ